MSGFVAAFPEHRSDSDGPVLEAMSKRLAHRGANERRYEFLGSPTIAVRNADRGAYQAAAFVSGDGAAIFDGMLWNEAVILDRFGGADIPEAIWRGFAAGGLDWLDELDWSFAIVIYDRADDAFHMARDRFATRPLTYALLPDKLLVGSEIKALVADPGFPRVLNQSAISSLLDVGFLPGPETLLENVFKVLPAVVITVRGRVTTESTFLEIATPPIDRKRTLAELVAFTDASIERTVVGYGTPSTRLGVLLSGGVDSALVAGKLTSRTGGQVRAVSFGATGWEADESGAAARIAKRLGLPFTRAEVGGDFDALSSLESAIWHIEEPTRFETSLALEVAFAAVADSVDAIATVDSADMLFGSKDHIHSLWMPALWRLPRAPRRAVAKLLRRGRAPWRVKSGRYLDINSFTDYAVRSNAWAARAEAGPIQPTMHDLIARFEDRFAHLSPPARLMMLKVLCLTAPWIERFEQIGAAHGIDAVHPYMRNEMLEYLLSTPNRLKVSRTGTRLKPGLTQLAEQQVGEDVAHRPKMQFAAPYRTWLNDDPRLRSAVLDLRNQESRWRTAIDPEWVDPVLDDFAANGASSRNTSRVVFILLGLEIWLRKFLHDEERSTR